MPGAACRIEACELSGVIVGVGAGAPLSQAARRATAESAKRKKSRENVRALHVGVGGVLSSMGLELWSHSGNILTFLSGRATEPIARVVINIRTA